MFIARLVDFHRTYVAEASQIGLWPGEWPEIISLMDEGGMPAGSFKLDKLAADENGGRFYNNDSGDVMHVLND